MSLVLHLPNMGRESGPRPVSVSAVTLMLASPVPDWAVRQASVGLLLASGEVSDLGTIHHPLGHAVAWDWALLSTSVAIATSTWLVVVAADDLGVVLVQHLCHVRHCGVGYFDGVSVDDFSQLVTWWEAGVNKVEELLANVG